MLKIQKLSSQFHSSTHLVTNPSREPIVEKMLLETYTDLFPCENVLNKEEIQLLVGRVDAKLLKSVCVKLFKAEDIQ